MGRGAAPRAAWWWWRSPNASTPTTADFRRYLELAAAVVADRGGDLYVGHELVDLTAPPGAAIVVQQEAALEVRAGAAATIFALNLGIWGHDPVLAAVASAGETTALLAAPAGPAPRPRPRA